MAATKQEKTKQEKPKQEKAGQAATKSGASKSATRKLAPDDIGRLTDQLRGDGLVPVKSALGRHDDAARALRIPASHQAICYGLDHFDLLSSVAVYGHLKGWLTEQ